MTIGVLLADLVQAGDAFSPELHEDLVAAFGGDAEEPREQHR